MKILSPCFSKRVVGCVAAFALFTGCTHAPVQSESPDRPGEPAPLPPAYEQALTLMAKGDYAAAIISLQRFIDGQPDLAGPYLNLGIAYQQTGRNDRALEALSKAIDLNPAHAPAWQQLGMVYRERGQFDAALESYDRALKLDPDYALAHRNIGILYDLYLLRPKLALDHYKTYLRLIQDEDPDVTRWIADLERRSANSQAKAGP